MDHRGASRRWTGVAIAGLALALLAGCGGSDGRAGSPTPRTSATSRPTTTPDVPSTPSYDDLTVGSNRYVNACDAYAGGGGRSVYAVFDQQILLNAVIQETYAENSLPASWYPSPLDSTTSSCSVELADPPWNQTTVGFSVEQFRTAAQAKANFTQYTPISKADLDKANRRFGTSFDPNNNTVRVPSLEPATYYQPGSGSSRTLVGNKILAFNLGTTRGKAANLAVLRRAVPVAVTRVGAASGSVFGSKDFGRRLGAATYDNPCKVLSADVFEKATGLVPDPTTVDLTFNGNAVSHPRPAQADGITSADCRRRSLQVGRQRTATLDLSVRYFRSAAQARHFAGVTQAKEKDQVRPVSGFGAGAFLFTFGGGATVYAPVGPYVVLLSGGTRAYGGSRTQDLTLAQLRRYYDQVAPALR